MARVSIQDAATVAPSSSPGNDYNSTQASSAAFGALQGQADQKLGGDLGQAGQNLDQVALLQQSRANQTATDAAFNQFQTAAEQITYGNSDDPASPPGIFTLHGGDAILAGPSAAKALATKRDEISAGLPNAISKLDFDQQSRRLIQYKQAEIDSHLQQEKDKFDMGVSKNITSNAAAGAANAYNSDQAFFDHQADARRGEVQAAQVQYGHNLPPEITQAAIRGADTQVTEKRASAWALNDPVAALSWLRSGQIPDQTGKPAPISQVIDSGTYDRLVSQLRPVADAKSSLDDANRIYTGTGLAPALPAGPIADKITAGATQKGIGLSLAMTTANIESGIGALPDRPGSQYIGPFQMGDQAWAARGGTAANRRDIDAQVNLGLDNLKHSQDVATSALGQPAQDWQSYLVHQQGDAGGGALLQAPATASAVDALTPAYGGDRGAAQRAVVSNGGQAGSTVGQFLQHWQQTYAAKLVSPPAPAPGAPSGRVQYAANTPLQPVANDASPAPLAGLPASSTMPAPPDGGYAPGPGVARPPMPTPDSPHDTPTPVYAADQLNPPAGSYDPGAVTNVGSMAAAAGLPAGTPVRLPNGSIVIKGGGTAPASPAPAVTAPSASASAPDTSAIPATTAQPSSSRPGRPDLAAMLQQASQAHNPNDPTGQSDLAYQQLLQSRIRTRYAEDEAVDRDKQKNDRDVLLDAAMGGAPAVPGGTAPAAAPGGSTPGIAGLGAAKSTAPTSLDQLLANPKARQAWLDASPEMQRSILGMIEHNSKAEDPPENQSAMTRYYQLRGQAAENPGDFKSANLADPALLSLMPHHLLLDLMNRQASMSTNDAKAAQAGINLTRAQSIVGPDIRQAGLVQNAKPGTPAADTYAQFTGRLDDALQRFQQDNKRRPNDDETKKIGQSLLTEGWLHGTGSLWGLVPNEQRTRLFQAQTTGKVGQFYPAVPATDQAQIASSFQTRMGRPPTDAEVQQLYMLGRQPAPPPRPATPSRPAVVPGSPGSPALPMAQRDDGTRQGASAPAQQP